MFYPWWMIIRLHQGGGQRARHNVRVYATAALPRLTMKWRVPYCNNGKRGERKQEREGGRRNIQLSNREAKYRNLFWQNRLKRLQREEYSVLGFFSLHSTSSVMKSLNALTRLRASEWRHNSHCQNMPLCLKHLRSILVCEESSDWREGSYEENLTRRHKTAVRDDVCVSRLYGC